MRIGYACLAVGVSGTTMRSCLMKNATAGRLTDLIHTNLSALERIIDYNLRMGILLFRISSGLIPFGSSPVNPLPWWDMYSSWLETIGNRIKSNGMRVSMHPGQYTILNSPSEEVVRKSIEDLNYHARVLDSLMLGPEHKLILHVGGLYNDRAAAMKRFIDNYDRLDTAVRKRLVIENDDKCFTVEDVLEISREIGIPVIYDTLHHAVNPCSPARSHREWIDLCGATWSRTDGPQKIHYAQQAGGKPPGAHSDSIDVAEFMAFFESVKDKEPDIMLEVKDKNLSALKCIRAVRLKYPDSEKNTDGHIPDKA